ncbi:hypothetical protein ACF0H5_022503 [Mactra antiquata]
MGNTIIGRLFGKQEKRIFIMGLDAAGKTTILYRLKLGEIVTTIPTIGFNVETVNILNFNVTAWDVGGRNKMRPLYRHYYTNTHGLVYIIDSNDKERFEYAIDELRRFVLDVGELDQVPLLVLANKQDLNDVMLPEEIASNMETLKQLEHRAWTVFGVSAVDKNNPGLLEAMEWLVNTMEAKEKPELSEKWTQTWRPASESDVQEQKQDDEDTKKSFFNNFVESLKKMFSTV